MEKTNDIGVWSANETVYSAGNTPEFNYLVIEGDVKVTAPNGYFLGRVSQGELFGEASFILGTTRSTTVIAGSNGLKARLIPPKHILDKLKKDVFLKVWHQNILSMPFCIIFRGAQLLEKCLPDE